MGLCYINYDDECVCQENRSTTTDVSRRGKKKSWAWDTLLAALSLSLWMMNKWDPAAAVCHHLLTSNTKTKACSYRLQSIVTYFHSRVNTSRPRFQSWRNFWVKCWLAKDQRFGSDVLFSFSLYHKSFNSAAQTVHVSPPFPFDTMWINYIKAGLVNLVGAQQ